MDVFANIGLSLLDLGYKVQAVNVLLCESNIAVGGDFSFSVLIYPSTVVNRKRQLIDWSD